MSGLAGTYTTPRAPGVSEHCKFLQFCTPQKAAHMHVLTHRKRRSASSQGHMHAALQVEVKLRLPGAEAHQKLEQLLAPGRVATHQQVCVSWPHCLKHTQHLLACC